MARAQRDLGDNAGALHEVKSVERALREGPQEGLDLSRVLIFKADLLREAGEIELAEQRGAVAIGVVLRLQCQRQAAEIEGQIWPSARLPISDRRGQRRLKSSELAGLHAQASHRSVNDSMAPSSAIVHGHIAHAHRLHSHLPEPSIGMIHWKPSQLGCQARRVVPTQMQLSTICAQCEAKLRETCCAWTKKTTEEAA